MRSWRKWSWTNMQFYYTNCTILNYQKLNYIICWWPNILNVDCDVLLGFGVVDVGVDLRRFLVLARVHVVADRAQAHEAKGGDDQPAERLIFRQDNDEDKFDRVHAVVQPVLDAVHDSTTFFFDSLLQDLSDAQVDQPKAETGANYSGQKCCYRSVGWNLKQLVSHGEQ